MPSILPKTKSCIRCGKRLGFGDKFCSRECKSLSQIKSIILICKGCRKQFSIWPYLKRKTNYCSTGCYLDSTRRKQSAKCTVCGKDFQVKEYLVKKGYGLYCSRKCQPTTSPKQVEKVCQKCSQVYLVPPSWATKRTFCSKKCQNYSMRDYIFRVCRHCNKTFELPRGDLERGRGNFCTYRCYLTYRGPSLLEEKMERVLKLANIKFEREIKFKRFHVDFLIRDLKTVIECDGEDSHQKPINQKQHKKK